MLEAIKQRRSIYPEFFNQVPVSEEEIQELLEAARYAPTHKLTEPWRFTVLMGDSKDRFQSFTVDSLMANEALSAKAPRMGNKIAKSSALLVIKYQRDLQERLPEWEELASTAMAVHNIWLYAGQLGLGGYWSTGKPLMNAAKDFVEMKEGEEVIGLFFLGKYDENLKERPRKAVSDFTTWMK
ncbi:nitroreductase family protein [Membranihabitans marinus]|uniref:nitroreductase family protein n=1 Tax=Membranihabitans marinus TaxID=1227546 RepID=UPI001F48EA1F|nr:nitroreductase [Membranihabitans marinus]